MSNINKIEKSIVELEKKIEIKMAELLEEKRYYQCALKYVSDNIIIIDNKKIIKYVNDSFQKASNYSLEEIIGKTIFFIHNFDEIVKKAIEKEKWNGQLEIKKADGIFYNVFADIYLDKNNYIIIIGKDASNEIELQNKFRYAQRMEAIRIMAGGIAHDFNNILFPIMGYTEMAMEDVAEQSMAKNNLKEVINAANRAKSLVAMILNFSRNNENKKIAMYIQPIIKEASKFLRVSLPSNIEIYQEINNNCGPIIANPIQIHQIFMNLCAKIYEKLYEKGGILKIEVIQTEKYVKIVVRDNIYDEINYDSDKDFNTICELIKENNGHISILKKIDKGNEFNIYFPQIDVNSIIADNFEISIIGGQEHILIVDDEKTIVDLLEQALGNLGYQVTSYTDSISAFEAFLSHKNDFDLIITDQIMPKMTGMEFSSKILNLRPDIPIILITGYTETEYKRKCLSIGISEFLLKPISIRNIAKIIRKLLDKV